MESLVGLTFRTRWSALAVLLIVFGVLIDLSGSTASAQLRVVSYNTATSGDNQAPSNPRAGMDIVLEAIGDESTGGIAKPIDVLLLQEQDSSATSTQAFVNILNGIYGSGTYARATLNGGTIGAGSPGMVFNTNTVQLLGQSTVGNLSGSGNARQGLRYLVRPVGYDSNSNIYLYNNHYKASTGASNESRRLIEASSVRNNADALGQGEHIIFAGDYNIQSSSEAMYQELLSSGNGQAFDPINRPGNWNNSSSFRSIHTQSPYNPSNNDPTLVSGGMDDRFDFQLVSGEMLDSEGLAYIPGSYHAFGNNGSHSLNDFIDDNSNTAQPNNVLSALASVSDHLPVVADYQLPAIMDVSLGSIPNRMLVGAVINLPVTVTNTASVVSVNGADELDYTVSGLGGVSGSVSGMDRALGDGMVHNFAIDASEAGGRVATINVNSTSQAVMNGTFSDTFNYSVLEHANASFDPNVDQNSLAIDFGVVSPCGMPTASFDIHNLLNLQAAGLDLDSIIELEDPTVFTTDLAPFSNLPIAGTESFEVFMDAMAAAGTYSASYLLQLTDEDIPGIQASQNLQLSVSGSIALPGDANLDGLVDVSDFNIWNTHNFTSGGDFTTGDFNCDGTVDVSDFNLWNANNFSSLDAISVPEPAPWTMFMLGSLWLARRSRKRKLEYRL